MEAGVDAVQVSVEVRVNYHKGTGQVLVRDLAVETKRITSLGSLTPDLWMKKAVGSPVSPAPLAKDAAEGLKRLS